MAVVPRGGWKPWNNQLAQERGYKDWAAWIADVERQHGTAICGARNQRDEPCEQKHKLGRNGRCRWHGRDSPSGVAAGAYKHGLRVAVLPNEMREFAEHTMEAADALSMLPDIATIDGRRAELFEQIRDGMGGPDSWVEVRDSLKAARDAIAAGKADVAREHMVHVDEVVAGALEQSDLWREVYQLADLRSRLTRGEIDRTVKLSEMITMSRVYETMGILADVFRELLNQHVAAASERMAVQHGLAQWTGRMLNAESTVVESPNGDRPPK